MIPRSREHRSARKPPETCAEAPAPSRTAEAVRTSRRSMMCAKSRCKPSSPPPWAETHAKRPALRRRPKSPPPRTPAGRNRWKKLHRLGEARTRGRSSESPRHRSARDTEHRNARRRSRSLSPLNRWPPKPPWFVPPRGESLERSPSRFAEATLPASAAGPTCRRSRALAPCLTRRPPKRPVRRHISTRPPKRPRLDVASKTDDEAPPDPKVDGFHVSPRPKPKVPTENPRDSPK